MRWTAPADNGAAITGYVVQYRPAGTTAWHQRSHRNGMPSTTISGLQAGTRYEVQVQAKNRAGTGPWSPAGTGMTAAPSAPAAPAAPTIRVTTAPAMVVQWTKSRLTTGCGHHGLCGAVPAGGGVGLAGAWAYSGTCDVQTNH